MKEIFDNIIKIIEQNKGVQSVIEDELKKYYEINKKIIDDSGNKFKSQMEEAMKTLPDPNDFTKVMQNMFDMLKRMIGEDTFSKMMELQQKYPFVQNITQNFFKK